MTMGRTRLTERRHLTDVGITDVRRMHALGVKQVVIARTFGVSRGTISRLTAPDTRICTVDDCARPQHATGLCVSHNKMRLRGEPLRKIGRAQMYGERSYESCTVDSCTEIHFGHGFCLTHYNLSRTYGIHPNEYERILREQNGVCAICVKECNSGKRLALDHDHETGEVRGLLCHNCNTAIGKFRDDVKLLQRAIDYLKKRDGHRLLVVRSAS